MSGKSGLIRVPSFEQQQQVQIPRLAPLARDDDGPGAPKRLEAVAPTYQLTNSHAQGAFNVPEIGFPVGRSLRLYK